MGDENRRDSNASSRTGYPVTRKGTFVDSYYDYVLRDYETDGQLFTVHFQMDPDTDSLKAILIRLYEKDIVTPRTNLFLSIEQRLKRVHGEPTISDDSTGSQTISRRRTWSYRQPQSNWPTA